MEVIGEIISYASDSKKDRPRWLYNISNQRGGYYFSLLIILDKDASFFLAIQKQDSKDIQKIREQKNGKFFKLKILAYFE